MYASEHLLKYIYASNSVLFSLQNSTITWDSKDPDLTRCFMQTILVWVPCAFLWLFTPLEIFYIRNSTTANIPYSFWNIAKLFITSALIVLTIVDLGQAINLQSDGPEGAVHFYTPVIKIASFILAAVLIYFNKKHGLRTSGLLCLFWFILTICSIPMCRHEARAHRRRLASGEQLDAWGDHQFISFMIFFSGCCANVVLHLFVDSAPRESKYPRTAVRRNIYFIHGMCKLNIIFFRRNNVRK
jgi:ATP-binding cassette, subfamily C (CFTR/MRP), member 1